MLSRNQVKITNIQREEQREKRKDKDNWHCTPPKSVLKKYVGWKVAGKGQKFGYDFEPHQSKPLKYMLEEFEQRAYDYYGGKKVTIPKALKNKDKYEKNL